MTADAGNGAVWAVGLMSGIQGRLNQQFAITIAVSVVISAFNALTLSPALPSSSQPISTILIPTSRGFRLALTKTLSLGSIVY